jgi:hypothetical protein
MTFQPGNTGQKKRNLTKARKKKGEGGKIKERKGERDRAIGPGRTVASQTTYRYILLHKCSREYLFYSFHNPGSDKENLVQTAFQNQTRKQSQKAGFYSRRIHKLMV